MGSGTQAQTSQLCNNWHSHDQYGLMPECTSLPCAPASVVAIVFCDQNIDLWGIITFICIDGPNPLLS